MTEDRKRLVEAMARGIFNAPVKMTDVDRMLRATSLRDAELALAAAERAGFAFSAGWRPIDELAGSIRDMALLSLHMMDARRCAIGYRDPLGVVRYADGLSCTYATHWMPLPPPPKGDADEAR